MPVCNACSGEDHEQEDCGYRDESRRMRVAGIQVTAVEVREMDEAARTVVGMSIQSGPSVEPSRLVMSEQCRSGRHVSVRPTQSCPARSSLACEYSCHGFNED